MANMKDVPSTERMVLCSQQWKLLSQKEKDAYHKKCDQVSCVARTSGDSDPNRRQSLVRHALGRWSQTLCFPSVEETRP